MSQNNPNNTDAILGGQNPPPVDAAVLGGLKGIEKRLTSESLVSKLQALKDTIQYGNEGINFALQSLIDPNEDVQRLARRLLRNQFGDKGKEALLDREPLNYFTTLDDWQRTIYNPSTGITDSENNAYSVQMKMTFSEPENKLNGYDTSQLESLIKDSSANKLQSLTVLFDGCLDLPGFHSPLIIATNVICEARLTFLNLRSIFFDASEIYVIQKDDLGFDLNFYMGTFLENFPDLEVICIRGCLDTYSFKWNKIHHYKLKTLIVEASFFEHVYSENVEQICEMYLPNLEYFKIVLGRESWIEQFKSMKLLMDGNTAPNLKYLSIGSNNKSDELLDVILESNILKNLEILDLSHGNMTDLSANKILSDKKIRNLKLLNLSNNSFSLNSVELLQQLPLVVQLTDQDDLRHRYFSAWE